MDRDKTTEATVDLFSDEAEADRQRAIGERHQPERPVYDRKAGRGRGPRVCITEREYLLQTMDWLAAHGGERWEVERIDQLLSMMEGKDLGRCPRHTPWGKVQGEAEQYGEGVYCVSTASHGGFWVAPERVALWPTPLRQFVPFAGKAGWYEEDCDWRIVALAEPHLFRIEDLESATPPCGRAPGEDDPKHIRAFFATPEGLAIAKRVGDYRCMAAARKLYRMTSWGTSRKGAGFTCSTWRRVWGDGPRLILDVANATSDDIVNEGRPAHDILVAAGATAWNAD